MLVEFVLIVGLPMLPAWLRPHLQVTASPVVLHR
jgi:hypothetical protein